MARSAASFAAERESRPKARPVPPAATAAPKVVQAGELIEERARAGGGGGGGGGTGRVASGRIRRGGGTAGCVVAGGACLARTSSKSARILGEVLAGSSMPGSSSSARSKLPRAALVAS